MTECFMCGEEMDYNNEPFINLPQYNGPSIHFCMTCAEDVEHLLHSELEAIRKHQKTQWIGTYGEG